MANLKLLAVVLSATALAQTPTSADPRVKFKDGERFLGDLAAALGLPRESVCKELSQYDCYSDAFRIVLGGMEPYGIRAVEPIEQASLTSPIALDRVALRVCSTRVAEDIKDPQKAVLYLAPAHVKNPDKKWKKETVARLYDKLLRRDASAEEIAHMMEFYSTVAAKHAGDAKDWVVLGCFSVASSLESVFY
jgi:hypothetical protein